MSIKVQGLDEAIRSLSKYSKEVQIDTAKAMNTSMLAVESKAKRNAPVDTGRLRSSIVTTKATQTDLVARTEVGVNYAPYIEFGTRSKVDVPAGLESYALQFKGSGGGSGGGMRAQPFLFPAWESERPKFEQAVKELLQR
jgi:HK97 gp10 family phage protein